MPALPDSWQATSLDTSVDETGDAATTLPPSADWLGDFASQRLTDLVVEALKHNTNVGQAAARLDAAMAAAGVARAPRFPALQVAGDASRTRFASNDQIEQPNISTIPGIPVFQQSPANLSWSLQASWEVDIWGRVRDRAKASRADAQASGADLAAVSLSIAGRVASGWFTLIEARQQSDLARRDVENRERTVAVIERRYDNGVSSSLDVRLARSDLEGRRATLATRQRTEREAARALEFLLGRYPAAGIAYPDTLPQLPALPGTGLPADLLTRRPDLLAAEARIDAAGLRVAEARKALLPQITLTGTLGPNGSNTVADLFDAEELIGRLVAGLTQPLFQGGRLKSDIRRTKAQAEEALYAYVETALTGFQEVENALDAEALLTERRAALERSLKEAAAAEAQTERNYRAGLTTIFDLLDAQSRRISAESALLAVHRERLTNRVALHVALGGAFSVPEPDGETGT